MDIRAQETSTQVVTAFPRARLAPDDVRPAGGVLAALASSEMAGRFCAWRGASDRRYVATVFPVDRAGPEAGLPDFDRFVLLAVAKGASRRVLSVRVVERRSDRRSAVAAALAAGANEWHVHLLAENRAASDAAVADLRARHEPSAPVARCA